MRMLLAVFHEFAHPEVLEKVKEMELCDIDVAPAPNQWATSEEEIEIVRTNAKLIKMPHDITGMRDPYESLTAEGLAELEKQTEEVLEKLTALGFVVDIRHPVTSAGNPMVDRVILSFPQ